MNVPLFVIIIRTCWGSQCREMCRFHFWIFILKTDLNGRSNNWPQSPPVPSGPVWPAPSCPAAPCTMWNRCYCEHVASWETVWIGLKALRELLQLAALLLVGSLELLVLHPQPLLLQHDLLVQTTQMSGTASVLSDRSHLEREVCVDVSYSCSSVMSFSLLSSSSLRLLICFWKISLWDWICFSTASCRNTNTRLQSHRLVNSTLVRTV